MEALQTAVISRRAALPALIVIALASGCVETGSFLNWNYGAKPSPVVCQIVTTWQSEVGLSPDPTRGGTPSPVLAGRLYLFGDQLGFPLEGDGKVIVECYNETAGAGGAGLERWELDRDTLKRLLRKDVIGLGYTLVLPWGTCNPAVKQVRMKVCYEPLKGATVYTENVVTVNGLQQYQTGSRTTKPGDAPDGVQPAAAREPAGTTVQRPAVVPPRSVSLPRR